jgi:hypothetical protein
LDEREDAFGRMLLDVLEGRRAHEVMERSDGHIGVAAGAKAYFAPFRRWMAVERRAMRFVRGRARLLPFEEIGRELGVFDTVVMMCNNFGLFGSAARARRMLKRLLRLTADDARIVAGSRNPYGTEDPEHLAFHAQNLRRGRMAGQLRLRSRHGLYRGRWFDYLLVSPEEMQELARSGGWRIERILEPAPEDPSYYVGILRKS